MATAGAMTRGIQEGRGTLGKLINDPKVANSLEASLKSVEEMTRRLNAGEGSLGKLMNDDAFSRTLTRCDGEPEGPDRQAESERRLTG